MSWPTAAELLLQASSEGSEDRSQWCDRLRWLGRYGLVEELQLSAEKRRRTAEWDALLALELSLALLLAGQGRAADRAVLEAHRLDAGLGLLGDPWGLWLAEPSSQHESAQALAQQFRRWRWLDPAPLWAEWQARIGADWTQAQHPPALDELALLLRHASSLAPSPQKVLPQLVDEAAIASDLTGALCFWGVAADILPEWDYARIKAADLALASNQPERCAAWLAAAPEAIHTNPWFWDINARHALQAGAITTALDHWGRAIGCADNTDTTVQDIAEVFRQRRREARRGPGVLQACSLLNNGNARAALALLRRLHDEDPQWPPLLSLLEQAEKGGADATRAPEEASERFAQLLNRAAARIGLDLPPSQPQEVASASDPQADREALKSFCRFLSDAEGRFALSG